MAWHGVASGTHTDRYTHMHTRTQAAATGVFRVVQTGEVVRGRDDGGRRAEQGGTGV